MDAIGRPLRSVLTKEELNNWRPSQEVEDDDERPPLPKPITYGELLEENPRLHQEVIHGLARRCETVNLIAPSKSGKSWWSYPLALCVVLGREFLGSFVCEQGPVLLIDNELHKATISNRIKTVADAMGIRVDEFKDDLHIISLRGESLDLYDIERMLEQIEPGTYLLVVLDAWYRSLPPDISENDNCQVMQLYNLIDRITSRLKCCFVCIHHSSKGSQAEKTVTDVGSGAGAMSRTADGHVILRQHEEKDAVVLECALRSFPPVPPLPLRFSFPLWSPADDLDPEKLKGRLNPKEQRQNANDMEGICKLSKALIEGPASVRVLRGRTGLGHRIVERLLDRLESDGAVRWTQQTIRGNTCRIYEAVSLGNPVEQTNGHF